MKYFALSSLLMAFCMQAGDNSKKMAPGAFDFNASHARQSLPRRVPITIISHHLTADYPANKTQQPIGDPASNKPKPVNLKSWKHKKPGRQTMFSDSGEPMVLVTGLLWLGQEINFTPDQGSIFEFKALSHNQTKNTL